MNENEKDYIAIDIKDVLMRIWAYKYIIILFVLISAIFMAVLTKYFTADTYTASGIIYVSSKSGMENEQVSEVDKGDIDAARTLSTTYIETLKTRSFLSRVSSETWDKYSWQDIEKMLTIQAVNETELLSVTIKSNSAYDSYYLAKNIIKLAPEILSKVAKGGSIEILDEVQKPAEPDDKGLINKTLIGGFIGALISVGLIFLLTFFDNKIRKSEDVEKRYGFSVLGIIEN